MILEEDILGEESITRTYIARATPQVCMGKYHSSGILKNYQMTRIEKVLILSISCYFYQKKNMWTHCVSSLIRAVFVF